MESCLHRSSSYFRRANGEAHTTHTKAREVSLTHTQKHTHRETVCVGALTYGSSFDYFRSILLGGGCIFVGPCIYIYASCALHKHRWCICCWYIDTYISMYLFTQLSLHWHSKPIPTSSAHLPLAYFNLSAAWKLLFCAFCQMNFPRRSQDLFEICLQQRLFRWFIRIMCAFFLHLFATPPHLLALKFVSRRQLILWLHAASELWI